MIVVDSITGYLPSERQVCYVGVAVGRWRRKGSGDRDRPSGNPSTLIACRRRRRDLEAPEDRRTGSTMSTAEENQIAAVTLEGRRDFSVLGPQVRPGLPVDARIRRASVRRSALTRQASERPEAGSHCSREASDRSGHGWSQPDL
jgi:hypothetical protein